MIDRTWRTVVRLGTAQTLAWASTYYLPAMLAGPMARDLGVSTPMVFAAFSLALLVSALVGPLAGRAIDQHGGRAVLPFTSLIFATGLVALALAQGPISLFAAWVVIGIGMGAGLYEAAFAALVRLHGPDSRNAITGITLLAGFASTVGWPLSTLLESQLGWRGACVVWAALHLLIGLSLNASLPRLAAARWNTQARHETDGDMRTATPALPQAAGSEALSVSPPPSGTGTAVALSAVFAITWFISTAMASHLPRLLQLAGASLTVAVAIGALVGPAQVAGRLLEFGLLRRLHPLLSARLASFAHPLGAVALLLAGAPLAATFAPLFAVLHGAGNGIMTIAKGTLPLVLFGPVGYGARQGLILAPSRFAQALAPLLFGLCLDHWGVGALWVSAGLGLAAFGILMALQHQSPPS